MFRLSHLFAISALLFVQLGLHSHGQAEQINLENFSPDTLEKKLKKAIKVVQPAVVSVKNGRAIASGVMINASGEVLTAAHATVDFKDENCIITLADGSKHPAKLVNKSHAADIALLKIKTADKIFPFAKPVTSIPPIGSFCFACSHPGGLKKHRPAQVRFGRIKAQRKKDEVVDLIIADANIQPGDSGGGLFDLSGNLIGLTWNAGDINTNRFSSMEMLQKLLKQLRSGEMIDSAPEKPMEFGKKIAVKKETLQLAQKELVKRVQEKHLPTIGAIRRIPRKDNKLALTPEQIVKILGADIMTLQDLGSISYGIYDPKITSKLPKLPQNAPRRIPLLSNAKGIAYALPISANEVLAKHSLIKNAKTLEIFHQSKKVPISIIGYDSQWDLAILQVNEGTKLSNALEASYEKPVISAGTNLTTRDENMMPNWGIACDSPRPTKKERYTGAMIDKAKISQNTGPYPVGISHTLPLFAVDACAPVFNLKGDVVALHMARNSRSFGTAIPIHKVIEVIGKIRASQKANPVKTDTP